MSNTEPVVAAERGVRIDRILCPLDFSEFSVKAYRYAQSIAGHYRAMLVVQNVVELWQHPSGFYAVSPQTFDEFRRKLIAQAQGALQQFVNTSGGLQPECIVQEGLAADAILSLAGRRAISLIVVGTHGRRGFDRLMLGSVAERVLRNAPCPVLAVREAGADAFVRIRRILCGVDFSAHSERALAYALSLADVYDAEVTVLNVIDESCSSAEIGKKTTAATAELEKLISLAAPGSKRTHLAVRLGRAYQEILQFAAEVQSDVIVTGVRGRQALDLAVFGSTTYRVIQLGRVPVLAVPI